MSMIVRFVPSSRPFWQRQKSALKSFQPPLFGERNWVSPGAPSIEATTLPAPHPAERMKPLRDRAREGRANPKGIAYLYLATNRETALAEVRPWIGSMISVGQFKTARELRIVNCTTDSNGQRLYLCGEPSPAEREESVWADIDRGFAKPVDPSDNLADYAPTQVLAELFKASGFDGIAYRSALGPGHNIALFDPDTADLVDCFLFRVKNLNFDFEEA
jgi:hypothetical protein